MPFNNIFDEFLDDNTNYVGITNSNPMVDNTSNYNAKQFECFKNKGLHFLHANARSIFHKLPELKLIAKQSNAAVIAISETWLDDSYTDACVQIEGYNIIRRDRASHAGGVCAYIREDLSYNIRSDLNNPDLEDLWFEILLKKSKPLYIGVCYRTNNNTKCFECLESTLSKLRSDCDFVVLGDFNVCLIKSKGKLGSIYRQLLNFFSSKQLINEPTRITETSSSLLDHIFTNNSEKNYQSGVLNIGLSDHLIVFCSRKIIRGQIGKHKTIKIRSVKNYSPIDFINKLRNVDWSTVTNCTDVNKAWDNFKTIFFEALDEVAPTKSVRIKNRTEPWMNSIILNLIRERDKILYKSNKNKNDKELRSKFNSLRNKVQREIRKAKTNFFKDKIEENKDNPKNLWKQFKSLGYSSKSSSKSKVILDIDNNLCFNTKENSNHMNNYFLNVASNLVDLLPPAPGIFSIMSNLFKKYYYDKNVIPNSFILKNVTENFVNTELSRLNPKKSYGIDGIQSKFIKDAASEIKVPITFIINLSISSNVVPNEFKYARVKPLFKKGNRNLPENYRPVSILTVVSKVLEKAIFIQFENYLKNNNILYSHQSGFRKRHSTDTCIINLLDYLRTNVSEGNYVGMVLLDLQKAFDTVDHNILCGKLRQMGVGSIEWFESYLGSRKQLVNIDGINSEPGTVSCGVPQGSLLGPLLFLCYVNDMPISIKCKLLLYADDSAILVSGTDPKIISHILSNELDNVNKWLIDNKLSLHLGKTESILFGTKKKLASVNNFNIQCNNTSIKSVKNVSYLGLTLDNTLSGDSIVTNIIKKSSSRLKFLYRHKEILNESSRKILSSALIQCHFDYCCSSWYSSTSKTLKNKLQVMQNKMIRFILNLDNRSHIGILEQEKVNMLPVASRVKQLKLNHVLNIRNNHCPEYLKENFYRISDTELRQCTRASRLNFFLPRVQNQATNTFYFSAIKDWNSLPAKIKEITNADSFRTMVKRQILSDLKNKENCPFVYYS